MTNADWLLLYIFATSKDDKLKNIIFAHQLDEALNILFVQLSKRNRYFIKLVKVFGISPDELMNDTTAFVIMNIHKYKPIDSESRPHFKLKSFVIMIVLGFWCDLYGSTRHERLQYNKNIVHENRS